MLFKNKNKFIKLYNVCLNEEEVVMVSRSPDAQKEDLKLQVIFKNSNIEIPFLNRESLDSSYEYIVSQLEK